MNLELGQYNRQELVNLYQEANNQLRTSLLAGQSWEDLQQQLAFVTQLAVMIDRQHPPGRNDAPGVYLDR
jgi:hypothetical protein